MEEIEYMLKNVTKKTNINIFLFNRQLKLVWLCITTLIIKSEGMLK